MPTLPNYHAFAGRHPETGSIANALAYQGVTAPHTGQPLSEALLLGISGGVAVGYFLFQYAGDAPHLALLTRNTFDPMTTIFDRLALPREARHTDNPRKAESNLIDALEQGCAPLVLADSFSLPYNNFPPDAQMWAMQPVVVFGVEDDSVLIADRSSQPLTVAKDVFMAARARVKQDKFRVTTLGVPDVDRLPAAVQKGIWQCLSLYTETPPKGAKHNFGLAALDQWANMLTNTRNKQSWTRFFPRGAGLFMALAGLPHQPGAFQWIMTWGAQPGAERGLYADFLDEAALILGKPALREVAEKFRASSTEWTTLAMVVLPDDVPLLDHTSRLLVWRWRRFTEYGDAYLDEIRGIDTQLRDNYAAARDAFPLDERQTLRHLEHIAEQVRKVRAAEQGAVSALQAMMASPHP